MYSIRALFVISAVTAAAGCEPASDRLLDALKLENAAIVSVARMRKDEEGSVCGEANLSGEGVDRFVGYMSPDEIAVTLESKIDKATIKSREMGP